MSKQDGDGSMSSEKSRTGCRRAALLDEGRVGRTPTYRQRSLAAVTRRVRGDDVRAMLPL